MSRLVANEPLWGEGERHGRRISPMSIQVCDVALSDIEIPKSRKKRVDLDNSSGDELLRSVEKQGILQPVLTRPLNGSGKYELVFGHRRLAVAKKLGLETIRATVDDDLSDEDVEFAILAENLFRHGASSATERRKLVRRWFEIHQAKLDGKTDHQAKIEKQEIVKGGKFGKKKQIHEESASSDSTVSARNALTDEKAADCEDEQDEETEQTPTCTEKHERDPFWKKVSSATGRGERSSKYDAAIAKAFNEEQLTSIEAARLPEDLIKKLSAVKDDEHRQRALNLVILGTDPDKALEECGQIDDAVKASAEKRMATDNLTDGDWLNQECGEFRNKLATTAQFDTSALLYRRCRGAFRVAKQATSEPMKFARAAKRNDPLTTLWSLSMNVKHPSEWSLCGTCSGAGVDPKNEGQNCRECKGCCFRLAYSGGGSK